MSRPRVADLTTAEKISLLHQHQPAIPRVGLAPFRTGTEALHGVAWLGEATVFPQAVALGATWDADLLRRIGRAVGLEVRAKHAADPEVSLNVWAPVVNPLRHPLWGRNEEGFAEDPALTAELAIGYASGLRGDHPRVWLTVPTLKHAAGYNAETDRVVLDVQLPPRVLHEYELPAFTGPLTAGVIGALMPGYNLINGRPCHLSRELIGLLREAARSSLAIVSDAGAPTNLAGRQHYVDDHVRSHAAALQAGIDSFTDHGSDSGPTVSLLIEALARRLITQADLDGAVDRLLQLRARTGEFEPEQPYDWVGPDQLCSAEHRALAREAAAKSAVLLTNELSPLAHERSLLPLRSGTTLAVVGPLARRVMRDWYSGDLGYAVSFVDALSDDHRVIVADGADVITLQANGFGIAVDPRSGLLRRCRPTEPATEFTLTDWGHDTCTLTAPDGRLVTLTDDKELAATADAVDGWVVQQSFRVHRIDDARLTLFHLGSRRWVRASADGVLEAALAEPESATVLGSVTRTDGLVAVSEAALQADTVIIAVGNDPHLLGRETEDRRDLAVPAQQSAIIRVARETNPQCVLVIMSSYPYSLEPAERCPAMVWTGHGGQEAGSGLADVLAGRQQPYGRLAQTWPAGDDQLADLGDYDIIGSRQTYWYSPDPPLFPFGHGLSYTEVEYRDAELSGSELLITVRNVGDQPVAELVQVYGGPAEANPRVPQPRRLLGHTRAELEPGQSRRVTVHLALDRLAVWRPAEKAFIVPPGNYRIETGRSSADIRATVEHRVTGPAPAPWPGGTLRAAWYDWQQGTRLGPESLLNGDVITAAGQEPGRIEFWNLALDDHVVMLRARAHIPAGWIELHTRPDHDQHAAWESMGRFELRAAEPDGWQQPTLAIKAGRVDLAITLAPGVDLAWLRTNPRNGSS